MPSTDYKKKVFIEIVAKWDSIKSKAYVIRDKDTGQVVTFGKYRNQSKKSIFEKNFETIKYKYDSESNFIKKEFKHKKGKYLSKSKQFKNFDLIATNKIIKGERGQVVIAFRDTNNKDKIFYSYSKSAIIDDEKDVKNLYNSIMRNENTKKYINSGNWELLSWDIHYYLDKGYLNQSRQKAYA